MNRQLRSLATVSRRKMAPIPIALCGKSSSMAQSFASSMLPEYESKHSTPKSNGAPTDRQTVTHHFQSTSAVHQELPPLLSGSTIRPSSGVGSNAESDEVKIPRAIVVGAGFSRSELDEMRQIEGAQDLPWLYPDPLKSAASMLSGPFLMSVIVKRAKSCLKSNGLEDSKESTTEPGVWGF